MLFRSAGNPIPGVRLRCTQWRQKEDAGTGGPHLAKIDLVSNAEGLVQIPHVHPVFPLTVNAEGPGFEWNSRKQTWPADEVVEWPLNPALPAKGTVLDKATGQPIAGAGLWWIDSHISFGRSTAGIERISTSHPLAVSGEDGTFAVTTLPRRIRHLLFVKAEGYAGSRLADVFAGQNDLKVQLVPPLHISGTLQGDLSRLPRSNKTGVPYFGYSYTIKSNQPDFFGTTSTRWATVSIRDGVGQFTIEDLWPDEWTFHVADHEIGKMELSDKSVEGISLSLEDVPPPPSLRQVVVKLVPPSGSPPPAGLIQVSYATVKNPIEHHNLRAANMLFDFDALSGTDVTVNSFNMIGYTFDYVRHKLKAGEGPHVIEIALRPAGATYGRVLSFDGAPTSEQDLPERERISITARAVGPIGQSRSAGVGTDGRFLVGPLELGGEYELTAWRGNYRVFGGSVKIDESQPLKELVIHLVKPGTIAGRVVNRDGRPVPRYQVNLSYRETRKGHTWSGPAGLTDADGKFSFEVNPQVPGEFELEDESRRVVPVVPNGPPLEIKVDADDSRLPPISAAGTNPAPVPAVHEPAATTETTDLSLADAASPLAPVLLPDWVEHVHSMVRRERAARDLRAISQALSVYADMQPLQYPTLPQEHLKNAATQGPADDLARTNLEAAKDAPANVEPAEKLPEQALVIRYSHAGLTNINICGGRMHYDWCEQNGIRQDLSSYDQYKVDLALTDDELARLARWLTEHKILKMENKFPPGDTRSYAAAFKGNLVVECGDKREFAWTDASELPAEFEAALEGFLALARDVRNRGERKAVGAPWAELLLPGSDTTVEHAVKAASWGDRGAAIVAKATGEARDLVGGRLPEGLRVVRQSFKIASVLKGELAAEQDVTVDYHVVNKDTTQERVIRQDQEVLLLLARQGGLGGGVWIVVKALPANDDNIASMKKLLPAGTAKLPGSEPHVDERIKAGARDEKRFIIVAQAQNDAFEVVGDDMFGWRRMVRQSFKVVASIRGDLAAGKSISVDYIVSEEGTHERVIRKGEQMIWILDRTDTEFWQGLKALADTPENRRQVVLSPRFAEPGSVGSAYKPTRRTPTPATHPTRLFPAQNYEMTRRFFLQNYETTRKLSTSKVM